jgi:glycosyltransferase involved in cell wall biosynthesis
VSLIFLRGQIEFMQANGFEVHVLVAPGPTPTPLPPDVVRHDVPIHRDIAPLADARALMALVRTLRRIRPHVIHCQTPKAGLLGVIAGKLTGVPVRIYHVRGLRYQGEQGLRRFVLVAAERMACRLATRVQSHGPSLSSEITRDRLCAPDKLVLVEQGSNGVDLDRFSEDTVSAIDGARLRQSLKLAPTAPVVLFVGRLHRDKGVPDLLEAWELVRARAPAARLVLLGSDELDTVGRQRLAEARNRDVVIAGEHFDPRPFYALADIVVLPTYREGMPNVLLEAAAMNRAVVATRTTGCVDIVSDGETGVLVEPRDPVALAQALLNYLHDPNLRQAHARNARAFVAARFSQRALWQGQAAEYRRLLNALGRAS